MQLLRHEAQPFLSQEFDPKCKLNKLTTHWPHLCWKCSSAAVRRKEHFKTVLKDRLSLKVQPSKYTLRSCNVIFITPSLEMKSVLFKSITDARTSLAALNQQTARMSAEALSVTTMPHDGMCWGASITPQCYYLAARFAGGQKLLESRL